jgi:hypothetical protein
LGAHVKSFFPECAILTTEVPKLSRESQDYFMFAASFWNVIEKSWKRNQNTLKFLAILGYAHLSNVGAVPTCLDHSPILNKDHKNDTKQTCPQEATTRTRTPKQYWADPDASCFWQTIRRESDENTSTADENITWNNFASLGLHQDNELFPSDESTRSSLDYSVSRKSISEIISSLQKIFLYMTLSDRKTQKVLFQDWITKTIESISTEGLHDFTYMLEVFYQFINQLNSMLVTLDKSFSHLDLSRIFPISLYYFLENEDERKNPSWKRRIHRFHSRVHVNQIFHFKDMLYLSKLSYAESIEEIQEKCRGAAEPLELIFCDLGNSKPNRPSHFIAVKKNQSMKSRDLEVVIVIRGTSTVMDVMTDCLMEAVPYRGGKAHCGILESGRYIANKHKNLLHELCYLYGKQNINLTLVGHSLGAGVASIAGIELSHVKHLKVRVIGFGCPSILSPDLAKKYENIITTVIADSDIVPRISTATVANVILDIMEFDWSELAKRDIFHVLQEAMESNPFLFSDQVLESLNTTIEATIEEYISSYISVPTSAKVEPELCPPGTCVHFYRDGSGITGVITPGEFFQEIDVTRGMFTDHMISTGYENVLLEFVRQHCNDHSFLLEDSKKIRR